MGRSCSTTRVAGLIHCVPALKLSEMFGLKLGGWRLSGHDKDEVLQSWHSGLIKVMVATTDFGLGVDQPDVETVVQIGVPPTMDTYIIPTLFAYFLAYHLYIFLHF